ncbi:cbb3-type cytochrome oxidase assembly protein CcoS [Pollutimonas nitritireducens]|uniref:Cbb3-type cytochrome oxidase assembly protein CcoS n=1 Tax=Pollutimonas nitritireducens TaxID=2045209 RepID=A0A2N4UIT0_9BURK|nr:cbb3-type cytochrome oxidase assembly protein CcoS [Pollutimonas nitritireducens]PLC54919.1 cbb3-type cytochrome oxidase assembly protein CcoS [Pollutimonas nitritireducens]
MASSLFLLLPISLVFVIVIGVFFWWAIFSGQFDDTQSRGESILNDDDVSCESPAVAEDEASKAGPHRENDRPHGR